jgi:hypothetical protein
MKNKKQKFIIVITLMTIILSCTKSGGDMYLGTWKNNETESEFTITKAGETAYTVVVREPGYNPGEIHTSTTTTTFKDGNLVVGDAVCFSYSNGKLICNGKEYEKVK